MFYILFLHCRNRFSDKVVRTPLSIILINFIMGELDALTTYITGIVKKCVSEVIAEEGPKLIGKDTKRYYSIDEACEKIGIKKSAFHDRANKDQFIIIKKGQSTLIDADDLDEKIRTGKVGKYIHSKRLKK